MEASQDTLFMAAQAHSVLVIAAPAVVELF